MEEMTVKTNKVKKFFIFMFMLAIATVVCGVSYVLATKEYELTREEILLQYSTTISTWTENTAASVNLWTDEINSISKRVSSSELYRDLAKQDSNILPEDSENLQDLSLEENEDSDLTSYLRNLMNSFMAPNGYTDGRILNADAITLLSSEMRPIPITDAQIDVVKRSISNGVISFSPTFPHQSGLLMHVADPLKPVFTQGTEVDPIGSFLFSTSVTSNIARFLTYNNQGDETITAFLVQQNKDFMEIIDVQGINFPKVDISYVFENDILEFGERQSVKDPSTKVWSSGLYIPQVNWWLIVEIPSTMIKQKLDDEAVKIYGFAGALTLGFILILALLWWIAVGREQKANAKRFESLYTLIDEQKRILDNVNAALDTGLLAADVTGTVIMVNRAFTELCNCTNVDIVGQSIAPIFDPAFTQELISGIVNVSKTGKPLTAEYSAMLSKETRLLRLTFYPFLDNELDPSEQDENNDNNLPAAQNNMAKTKAGRKYINAALITFTDITEFRRQSNAKKHVQEKSMQALVKAVESMDPYLTGHSRRMEQLGILVCKTLHLADNDVSTVAIAANLSQIGKLFVSRDLLLKQGSLTPEDKAQLLSIPEKAWLTLKEIDFNLPIPEAVHDMYERLDGKGYPRKLSSEEINIHARVLSVVNTFCAMTAPRSYRRGVTIDDALTFLRNDKGFDQTIVSALDAVLRTPDGLQVARAMPDDIS